MDSLLHSQPPQTARRSAAPPATALQPGSLATMTHATANDPQQVLADLYDEHAAAMFRWVVGMLGRPEDAEDAVHAVWLKLARQPARLANIEDLSAYTWKAMRHHVNSVLRRRALERLWTPPLAEGDAEVLPVVDGDAIAADQLRDLTHAVRRLRPRFRAVVLLVNFAGYTLEEAALRLGIPRGTAASRHYSAIQKLKIALHAGN